MEKIVYNKATHGKGEEPTPGTWWSSGGKWVSLACHECGLQALLNHTVSDNGDVNPSLVCPYEPCTMHVFGTLKDWTPLVD
jgi:hypothetical protein